MLEIYKSGISGNNTCRSKMVKLSDFTNSPKVFAKSLISQSNCNIFDLFRMRKFIKSTH